MRRIPGLAPLLSLGLLLLPSCSKKSSGPFSFSPTKPVPGGNIIVTYKPAGADLERAAAIDLVAYFYSKDFPRAVIVPMEQKGKKWSASFRTDPETRGVVLKFQSGDDIDNNEKKGYVVLLYDGKGAETAGALAGLADAYSNWGSVCAGMDADNTAALDLYEKDFALHPDIKKNYLSNYLSVVSRLKKTDKDQIIARELEALAERSDLMLADLNTLYYWYNRTKKTDLARKYAAMIMERDPAGEFIQAERIQRFFKEPDPVRKMKLFEDFKKEFPRSKLMPNLLTVIVAGYRNMGKYAEAGDFLLKNSEILRWTVYFALAKDMAAKKADLLLAAEFAGRGVELARREHGQPSEEKPSYLTEEQWQNQRDIALSQMLDLQGMLLIRLEKNEEALKILEETVLLAKGREGTANEHYAEALLKKGEVEKAFAEMEKFIGAGAGTAQMKNFLKDAYQKKYGAATGYPQLLERLERSALEKLSAKLKKELIDIPAPEFTLEDLQGQDVALPSFQGKVVVLDFWAAWCGPCRAAFPGMAAIMEKYKDAADVAFLFINSWETAIDKKKNADNFVKTNGYPFRVLLDVENSVIDAFRVDGIPTKFVLDKKGKIRFKSVGFNGNTDKLVEELSLLIDMLR